MSIMTKQEIWEQVYYWIMDPNQVLKDEDAAKAELFDNLDKLTNQAHHQEELRQLSLEFTDEFNPDLTQGKLF